MYFLNRYKLIQLALAEASRDRRLKRLEGFLKETGFQVIGRKFRGKWYQDPVFIQGLSTSSTSRSVGNWLRGLSYRKKPSGPWIEDLKQFPLEEKYRLHAIGSILCAPLDAHDSLSEADAQVVTACLRGLFDDKAIDGIVYEDEAPKHVNLGPAVRKAVETMVESKGPGAVVPLGTGAAQTGTFSSVDATEPEGMEVTLVTALEAMKRRYAVKVNGHLVGRCPDLKPSYVGFDGRLFEKFDGWMLVRAVMNVCDTNGCLVPEAVCKRGRILVLSRADRKEVYGGVGSIGLLGVTGNEIRNGMLYFVKLTAEDFVPYRIPKAVMGHAKYYFPTDDGPLGTASFGIDIEKLIPVGVDVARLISEKRLVPIGAESCQLMLTVYPGNIKGQELLPANVLSDYVTQSIIDGSRLVVFMNPEGRPDPTAETLVGQTVWLHLLRSLVGPFTLLAEDDGRFSVDLGEAFSSGTAVIKQVPEGTSQLRVSYECDFKGGVQHVTRTVTTNENFVSDVPLTNEYRYFLERASFFLNPQEVANGRFFQRGGARAVSALPKPPQGLLHPEKSESETPDASAVPAPEAVPDARTADVKAAASASDAAPASDSGESDQKIHLSDLLPPRNPARKRSAKPEAGTEAKPQALPQGQAPAVAQADESVGTKENFQDLAKASDKAVSAIRQAGEEQLKALSTAVQQQSDKLCEDIRGASEEFTKARDKYREESDAAMKRSEEKTAELAEAVKNLDKQVAGTLERFRTALADSMAASRLLDSVSSAKSRNEQDEYAQRSRALKEVCDEGSLSRLAGDDLTNYLCAYIQAHRPSYSRNFIVSLAVLLAQNFITIFSGDPGCGKTSACSLLGSALGLTPDVNGGGANRLLMVSVEKGWTNRRDMFGYFNPLSGAFVTPDPRRQAFLRELHADHEAGMDRLPYLLVLDEANLSQIEYYCTDFISMADKRNGNSQIALGDGTVCHVPDTLRILMTANADQTVESFSPRLLDRAWVVSMPEFHWNEKPYQGEKAEQQIIDWQMFVRTFGAQELKPDALRVFESHISDIADFAQSVGIGFSPRTYRAIRGFFSGAIGQLRGQYGPYVPAIDFAIAQKILPRVSGHGDAYRERLEAFRKRCALNHFEESLRQIDRILAKGDENVGFYQFF